MGRTAVKGLQGQAGAGGRNRTGTRFPPTDFLTLYGFRRRQAEAPPGSSPWAGALRRPGVCGLDYPFAMARIEASFRRCPSSLYTFPAKDLARAWLGIAS